MKGREIFCAETDRSICGGGNFVENVEIRCCFVFGANGKLFSIRFMGSLPSRALAPMARATISDATMQNGKAGSYARI